MGNQIPTHFDRTNTSSAMGILNSKIPVDESLYVVTAGLSDYMSKLVQKYAKRYVEDIDARTEGDKVYIKLIIRPSKVGEEYNILYDRLPTMSAESLGTIQLLETVETTNLKCYMYEQNVLYFVGESKDTFFNALYAGEEKKSIVAKIGFLTGNPETKQEYSYITQMSGGTSVSELFTSIKPFVDYLMSNVDTNYYGKNDGISAKSTVTNDLKDRSKVNTKVWTVKIYDYDKFRTASISWKVVEKLSIFEVNVLYPVYKALEVFKIKPSLFDGIEKETGVTQTSKGTYVLSNMQIKMSSGDVFITVTYNIPEDISNIVPPTEEPPTEEPPTDEPPTDEPPTDEPPTDEPPADEPPADEPPADEPPADEPPTDEPPTEEPPTDEPPTEEPPCTTIE